jgi:DNA-binding HxlR family transcriptional regulator
VAGRRNYDQVCPIAHGLDVLGERWTLLILRELVGGPRRYSDLRAQLPGIATNLLAQRLNELGQAGIVARTEVPAPIARTVYSLTDVAWRLVVPILGAIARFGLETMRFDGEGFRSSLNGFLVGVLLGFDAVRADGVQATYRVQIDGRSFDFAVTDGRLAAARGEPDVMLTASTSDLAAARFGRTVAQRKAALRKLRFDGKDDDVERMRSILSLTGERLRAIAQ